MFTVRMVTEGWDSLLVTTVKSHTDRHIGVCYRSYQEVSKERQTKLFLRTHPPSFCLWSWEKLTKFQRGSFKIRYLLFSQYAVIWIADSSLFETDLLL